jgi:hypothetical protein
MIRTLTEPEIKNHFPRCVAMKLHFEIEFSWTEKFVNSFLQNKIVPDIDLLLTIDFGSEQEILIPAGVRLGLPEGKVKFGIKRGELELRLENCYLEQDSVVLKSEFKLFDPCEKTIENSNKFSADLQPNEKKTISGKASAEIGSKQITKFDQLFWKINKVGDKCNPLWVFEISHDENYLKGNLTRQALGTLTQTTKSDEENLCPSLIATFSARSEDAFLSWGQVAFTPNITRNKLAAIERAIALRYIKYVLQESPLSEIRWNYG